MKNCSRCKGSFEYSAFYKDRTRHDGFEPVCKECSKQRRKERGWNSREYRCPAQRVIREKKDIPCTDCGQRYPHYVMDFDHIPELGEKVCNVSKLAHESQMQPLLAEIAKCEVVCANCHRERTHQRQVTASQ